MRAAHWSPVVVAVLLLAGCGQTHAQTHTQTNDSTLHLTENDNGKKFNLKPRGALVVTLASNPSTGYSWEIAPPVPLRSPLRLVSHRYVASKKNVPGAAGSEVWRFRAVGHGRSTYEFLHRRSSGAAGGEVFSVTIHVR